MGIIAHSFSQNLSFGTVLCNWYFIVIDGFTLILSLKDAHTNTHKNTDAHIHKDTVGNLLLPSYSLSHIRTLLLLALLKYPHFDILSILLTPPPPHHTETQSHTQKSFNMSFSIECYHHSLTHTEHHVTQGGCRHSPGGVVGRVTWMTIYPSTDIVTSDQADSQMERWNRPRRKSKACVKRLAVPRHRRLPPAVVRGNTS